MGDNIEMSVSLPLDSDGFLRRGCPTCDREFKWLHAQDESEAAEPPDEGYFCPYCGVQARTDAWWTEAQLEYVRSIAVGHATDRVADSLSRLNKPGSRVSFKRNPQRLSTPEPPIEPDDMRRVDFACHPGEPVKVGEDWERPVHCLMCGTIA